MNKWVWIGLGIAAFVAFLAWLFIESSKPLPGEKLADLGRGHVDIGENVEYNSNPPTSGKHYGEWIRSGVYDTPKDDRNLVHSLEHGYVILSYKCNTPSVIASPVTEYGVNSAKQSSTSSSEIATGSSNPRNDEECKARNDQLTKVYESKGKRKLIVVPRENLETNFALTAWNYIDKFSDFDASRVERFIDAHLNQGPEKTME